MFYWHFLYCQDEAIDESEHFRLTNLQSLQQSKDKRNSPVHKPINEPSKISEPTLIAEGQNHQDNNEDSILTSPEDETECVDELPLFVSQQPTTENYLAKRTLMQEENESDLPIKEEPTCYEQILDAKLSKRKPSSKAKKIPENEKHEEPLMLTADKMMDKELTVLHTPIVMNDSISRSLTKKSSLKIYSKNISKTSGNKEQIKTEDDSASEEEKQWVTAKKRRSKRLEKKQEDARIEDAKRAKRVSEFIEKRGTREVRKRAVRGRRLRSRHNFMERQKQLRFRRTTNSPSLQATIPDDECILPDSQDNDNEEISPDPATSTSRISNHLGTLNFFVSKATKKSCPKNELENKQSTSKLTTPIVNSNVIANGSPVHTDLQAVTKTAMSTSDLKCHTICILSDDDDDDTNLITPDVVPLSQKAKEYPTVSNTAAPTQQAKSSSANLGTSVNQQKPAIVPLRNSKEIMNVPSDDKKAIAMSSYRKRLFNITYENDKKDSKGGQTVSLNDKTKISNSNLPKRLYQPGDIIRVNSKGEIVVVNKKNTPVKSNSNEKNKLTKEKPIQNNSQIPTPTKNLFNVDRKKETNEMHVFENLKMQHQKEATTSTSTDPRALLKNVVKIQSDVYENKQNTQPSKTLPVNQTRKVNTLPVVKLNNNSNAKSHHATPLNNKPELITSKKEFPNQKLLVETIQNLKVPIQTKRATINSIDLTNYHTEESPKDKITIVGRNSEIKNKHALIMPHKGVTKIGLSATVVGSPKEILFCRTADKSSFMTSVDLTANPGYSNAAAAASSAKSSSVNIKKPSMSKDEMIIAKKKVKPNVSDPKLLTLKDFDIDDIVELE